MYNTIKTSIKHFCRDEEGASGIEYALLAAMVAIALATVAPNITPKITTILNNIATALQQTP